MCLQAADKLRAAVCLITSGCPPASAAAAHVCLPDFLQGQSLTSELPGSCDILSDDLRRCSQRSSTRRRVSRSHMLLEKLGLFTPGNRSLERDLILTCICSAFFRGHTNYVYFRLFIFLLQLLFYLSLIVIDVIVEILFPFFVSLMCIMEGN